MRGKKSEITALERGLAMVEQGMDYIPDEIAWKLNQYSVEELEHLFIQGCNLTSLVMAQKGWILMEIKKRVGHGHFKDHLRKLRVSYEYGRRCMNVARAIARHPDLANIQDTHLLRRVVYLPEAKQEEIAVKLKRQVTRLDEHNKPVKVTEEWHDLRPWILEQIGYGFEQKKSKPPRPLPPTPDYSEPDWKEIEAHFDAVYTATARFVTYLTHKGTLHPSYYDRIIEHEWAGKLVDIQSKMVLLMRPLEEVLARTPVERRKSFAER